MPIAEKSHQATLNVSFGSLRHNLNQYRNLLPDHTKMMVMVKANAYGCGIVEVANFLQNEQVDMLGVAYLDAAIDLRNNDITTPIMVMNPHIENYAQVEKYNLQPNIFNIDHLRRLLSDTENHPTIHIKIDSGMHRLGFSPDQLPELLSLLGENSSVKVEGIYTHFSSSDMRSEDGFTHHQASTFNECYEKISTAIGYKPTKHALNSSGTIRFPQYHFDMIRLGIGFYGFDTTDQINLKTASQLQTTISQIQILKKGETVGYARRGKLEKDSLIAIIPIGYEDGYLRVFGNGNATVNINGVSCPTVGNICMDMTMIDVTDVKCSEGDKVTVFGESPTIQQLANWSSTIPYEILTNVGNRVKRVFIS